MAQQLRPGHPLEPGRGEAGPRPPVHHLQAQGVGAVVQRGRGLVQHPVRAHGEPGPHAPAPHAVVVVHAVPHGEVGLQPREQPPLGRQGQGGGAGVRGEDHQAAQAVRQEECFTQLQMQADILAVRTISCARLYFIPASCCCCNCFTFMICISFHLTLVEAWRPVLQHRPRLVLHPALRHEVAEVAVAVHSRGLHRVPDHNPVPAVEAGDLAVVHRPAAVGGRRAGQRGHGDRQRRAARRSSAPATPLLLGTAQGGAVPPLHCSAGLWLLNSDEMEHF